MYRDGLHIGARLREPALQVFDGPAAGGGDRACRAAGALWLGTGSKRREGEPVGRAADRGDPCSRSPGVGGVLQPAMGNRSGTLRTAGGGAVPAIAAMAR